MKYFIFVIVLSMLLFPIPDISAQFYKYKDKNGITIFTDDLSQVPREKRPKVKVFESTVNNKAGKMVGGEESHAQKTVKTTKNRAWFIKEQKVLKQERKRLDNLKESVETPAEQKTYNNRVRALNKRIDSFKNELDRYYSEKE